MATGEAPVNEMIEGYLLALSGLLLFVPGFFTDGLGILLLIPPCRRKMANWALKKAASSQSTFFRYGQSDAFHTFEGEFTREQEKQNPIEHDKR